MKCIEIIKKIEAMTPDFAIAQTCDVVHFGDAEQEVKGIVSCFMADVNVVKKAAQLGANFIITHEPTWYSSWEDTSWLEENPVYEEKKKLLEKGKITIWRYHDHMHAHRPDLIYAGVEKELGWEKYRLKNSMQPHYSIETMRLGELNEFLKKRLDTPVARVIGNPDIPVKEIGVLVGGGSLGLGDELMPAKFMTKENLDVLVCGEINEWTSCSFVRDAAMLGMNKAMIILGHNRTEEAGMKYFADILQDMFPEIPVTFVASGEPVIYL